MGERTLRPEDMATTSTAVATVAPPLQEVAVASSLCCAVNEIAMVSLKLFGGARSLARAYSTKVSGQLNDINVLDLTRIIAGPVCTMILGDLGANIIKVESLDGDEARKWGPPFVGNKDSVYFMSVNRNKKSICIDFKSEDGKKIMHDLARKCDVLVENFLPGKLDKMNVGYEKLKQVNPKLIYCAITGFGPTGPYAKRPGYDVIASAMGGLMNVTGERDGNPVKVGVAITDLTTGLHAYGAIMTALYTRQKTNRGQKIDCNLLSSQIAGMINVATIYLNCGIEGQRWGTAHANLVPYQGFNTKDGQIIIGTGSNAQFADLCKLEPVQPVAVITLRPARAQTRKKVVWTEDTVDNEHMNKKKSKCCCIYEKPRRFGESDSESSDDECEHCFGHVEKRRAKHQHQHEHQAETTATTTDTLDAPAPEPTAAITLKPASPAPAPPDPPAP